MTKVAKFLLMVIFGMRKRGFCNMPLLLEIRSYILAACIILPVLLYSKIENSLIAQSNINI